MLVSNVAESRGIARDQREGAYLPKYRGSGHL
jgi:hypothetical protein